MLYHILSQQPGLVIVFVNAISALRRLLSILKILRLPVEGLHGNMQQRARLKYLDRFRAASGSGAGGAGARRTSVLVATDVAARGIDIKGVYHLSLIQISEPTRRDTQSRVEGCG